MFTKKETAHILVVILILAFSVSLVKSPLIFLYALLAVFLVVLINIIAKKVASFYLDSEIEIGLWEIRRSGMLYVLNINPFRTSHPSKEFKTPFPAGIVLPIITTAFSLGNIVWMASLVFDVKPKVYRAAKRYGLYSFSEMTEYHVALIASAGIITTLIFSLIGYLIGFSMFAKISVFYAFFNLLPLSDLDGNKIFFGSLILWSFLASIVLIAMAYVFLLV